MCQTIENKDKHQTKNTKHDDVLRTQTSEWNSRKRNMQSAYELRCLRHDVLYLCKWTESHTVKAKALAFQRRLVRSFRKVSHFSTKKKANSTLITVTVRLYIFAASHWRPSIGYFHVETADLMSHAIFLFSRVTTEIVLRNTLVGSNKISPANVSSFFSRYRTIIVDEDVPTATELVFVRRDWSWTRANPKEEDLAEFSSNLAIDNGQRQDHRVFFRVWFMHFDRSILFIRGEGVGRGRGRETVTVKPVLSGTVFLMANLDSYQVV